MLERQARMESVLAQALATQPAAPPFLLEAMRYAALDGGKRVRPLLSYAAGEAVQAAIEQVDAPAAAVELIHAYSLVHDDLPCMDNDSLRRGKPTCHVAFGEANALLVGDSLQSLAFAMLTTATPLDPRRQLELVGVLAHASGAGGMAGGQAVDLASTRKSLDLGQLEGMHRMKTGALIGAAVRMGGLCGHGDEVARGRLDAFADIAGLLFQVIDDLLDTEQDVATLGKTPGKDAEQGKVTFVSVMGREAARRYAKDLESRALAGLDGFGAEANRLRQICEFISRRTH
jgi:farnesyl diphosphate synthase